jgi:hypothetical protein
MGTGRWSIPAPVRPGHVASSRVVRHSVTARRAKSGVIFHWPAMTDRDRPVSDKPVYCPSNNALLSNCRGLFITLRRHCSVGLDGERPVATGPNRVRSIARSPRIQREACDHVGRSFFTFEGSFMNQKCEPGGTTIIHGQRWLSIIAFGPSETTRSNGTRMCSAGNSNRCSRQRIWNLHKRRRSVTNGPPFMAALKRRSSCGHKALRRRTLALATDTVPMVRFRRACASNRYTIFHRRGKRLPTN